MCTYLLNAIQSSRANKTKLTPTFQIPSIFAINMDTVCKTAFRAMPTILLCLYMLYVQNGMLAALLIYLKNKILQIVSNTNNVIQTYMLCCLQYCHHSSQIEHISEGFPYCTTVQYQYSCTVQHKILNYSLLCSNSAIVQYLLQLQNIVCMVYR